MGQVFTSTLSNKTMKQTSTNKPKVNIDYDSVSQRFSVLNGEELQHGIDYLDEYGYAVFSDVLTSSEASHGMDLFWKYLENLRKPFHIQRNNPETWDKLWPGVSDIGLLADLGMGQSEFMWFVRGNVNVKKVFSQIWNSNELFVSFDGAGCFRDWHINPEWKTVNSWFHCDQNPFAKPNKCSIQGLVSLLDSDESTGGFVVVPGSHKHFLELQSITEESRTRTDFISIPDGYSLFEKLCPRLVKCKAGDLIVWDSRCIHCNVPAIVDRKDMTSTKLLRVVAYVCMSPLSMFVPDMNKYKDIEEFRKLREEFVRNRLTCTHWPFKLSGTCVGEGLYFEEPPIKLNAFQHSLVIGTNVEFDNGKMKI